MDIIKNLTEEQIRTDLPQLNIGDTVKVHFKVIEGNRERVQVFEGTIIKKRGGGVSESFTVRRISYGVGVERVFPMNSPIVAYVKVVSHGKVRRAKLYYLRGRKGKSARITQKI